MTFLFPLPLKLIPLDGQVLGESDKASNPVAWRRQQRIQHGGLPPQRLDQGDPSPPRVLRSSAAEPCFTLGKEQLITAPSPPQARTTVPHGGESQARVCDHLGPGAQRPKLQPQFYHCQLCELRPFK